MFPLLYGVKERFHEIYKGWKNDMDELVNNFLRFKKTDNFLQQILNEK
jgi:hypothetical protein